ncbi:MAG: NAD(P)(+) transhydrogenase (Re/Si-specific) subunit beta [Sandaracinaceae bacterium]
MSEALRTTLAGAAYLLSSGLFIYGLKRLSKVRTARSGNAIAGLAMLLAILGTLVELGIVGYQWILGGLAVGWLIGAVAAVRVEMTAMPEMVALFNGFGGAASALVALGFFWLMVMEAPAARTQGQTALVLLGDAQSVTSALSVLIGGVTFTGSLIAFLKLRGSLKKGAPILLPGRHVINVLLGLVAVLGTIWFSGIALGANNLLLGITVVGVVSLVLGVLLVIPIGGADMPVVVSLLNSYSGVAASAAGFVIGNPALIIAGAMVGAAGLILTNIMCVAMNRSLLNVLVGGFGQETASKDARDYANVTSTGPEETAMVLEGARSVIVVPGYGLAVAQAQHVVKELATELGKRGAEVRYAIHPVAGRMPGHMNVLLAEADVPYEQLIELEAINSDFPNTDAVIVIGANDVVNPAAIDDETSPIAGMPILHVHEARTVFVVKRSLSPGYAGIKNPLFERDNTMMLFGDAKKMMQETLNELREL